MIKHFSRWGYLLPITIFLAACETTGDGSPRDGLQLVLPDQPTASVTIRNPYDFTIGVVGFEDCETGQNARPEPQVIPPGESATYQVAPRCYRIISGEAGLSTNFATNEVLTIRAGDEVTLPR